MVAALGCGREVRMGKALLVVDMQNICVGEEHAKAFTYDNEALIRKVNEIISTYRPDEVYYVLNVMKDNWISKLAPFQAYEGSRETKLVDGLNVVSQNHFVKYKGDAFSNPALGRALRAANVTEVAVVGVDGGGCVARTALGARKEGYRVTMYANAVGTVLVKRANRLNKKLRANQVAFRNA